MTVDPTVPLSSLPPDAQFLDGNYFTTVVPNDLPAPDPGKRWVLDLQQSWVMQKDLNRPVIPVPLKVVHA